MRSCRLALTRLASAATLSRFAVEGSARNDLEGREGRRCCSFGTRSATFLGSPLSLPTAETLARRCAAFLRRPNVHDTIDAWSRALRLNRCTFTRLFPRETGMSFVVSRQRGLPRHGIAATCGGEAVTTVAMDQGYDNPAAFTSMLRLTLGASPRAYLRTARG
jgi:AraC-like DNA-binding protein